MEEEAKISPDVESYNGYYYCSNKNKLLDSSGVEVELRNKSLTVFLYLAKNSSSILTYDDIQKNVWKHTVVTRDSIHQCVRDIRKALKDENQQVLRTVSRRGYQLIADKTLSDNPIPHPIEEVGEAHSTDGTRIVWRKVGSGIPLLKASNWIADVDMAGGNRVYSEFYRWLASATTFVRYDQRGTGLSERNSNNLSIEAMIEDIDAVAVSTGIEKFFLFGASQGAAFSIAYADRFPDKVLGLIFRGGMVVGPGASGEPAYAKWLDTARTVVKNGWDSGDHGYRRYFSSRIAAEGSVDILQDLDELQRLSVTADTVIANFEFMDTIDLQSIASKISHPTLIMHSEHDVMVPFKEGRRLHRLMPHASFVTLDGSNHAVLPGTRAFTQACNAIESFIGHVADS